MRPSSLRRGLSLGLTLCALAALATGCKSRSQLIVGIITNLKVKGELSNVQMDLSRENVLYQSYNWDISDQQALDFVLPGSLTLYSDNGGAPVAGVTVTGYKGSAAKVVRTATIQLQPESDVFYRMSLVFKCTVGMASATDQCPEGFGCVEGICKPNAVSAKSLTAYTPDRVGNIECDSGTQYLSTGTCSPGPCMPMPVTGQVCADGEFCSEGTCYARDPANPRLLEFGEACDPSTTDACRELGLVCAATKTGDRARCRQKCTVDTDCMRRLPDALAAGVPATYAHCTTSGTGSVRECTYACDPLNAADGGCVSGTSCALIDVDNAVQPLGPECVTVRSSLVVKPLDAVCTGEVGECGAAAVCLTTGAGQRCRKLCDQGNNTCPGTAATCTPLFDSKNRKSPTWGACCATPTCT